jgi:hypothetical protein
VKNIPNIDTDKPVSRQHNRSKRTMATSATCKACSSMRRHGPFAI